MKIRQYIPSDCSILLQIFHNTVHKININDYNLAQIDVWADGNYDLFEWNKNFLSHNTLVVEIDEIIVGFGDMSPSGHLDKLYVHCEYQRIKIATSIISQLEFDARNNQIKTITTFASITALPFFKQQGFQVICKNFVNRNGIELINYKMQKSI